MSNTKYTGPYLSYELIFEIMERSDIRTWAFLEFLSKTTRAFFLGCPIVGTRGYNFKGIRKSLRMLFPKGKLDSLNIGTKFLVLSMLLNGEEFIKKATPFFEIGSTFRLKDEGYNWSYEKIELFNVEIGAQEIFFRADKDDIHYIFYVKELALAIIGPFLNIVMCPDNYSDLDDSDTVMEKQRVVRYIKAIMGLPVSLILKK